MALNAPFRFCGRFCQDRDYNPLPVQSQPAQPNQPNGPYSRLFVEENPCRLQAAGVPSLPIPQLLLVVVD